MLDCTGAVGSQRGHRKCHRNTMIAKRIEFSGVELLFAWNREPVLAHVNRQTHTAAVLRDGRDTVRFLYAQLCGISHDESLVACSAEHREHRYLIDQRGGLSLLENAAANRRFFNKNIADQFTSGLLNFENLHVGSHADQEIEQRTTRRIQTDSV